MHIFQVTLFTKQGSRYSEEFVIFIEFYSKVGPEVALDTTLSFLIRNLVLRKGISQTRVKQNKKVEGKKNVNMI